MGKKKPSKRKKLTSKDSDHKLRINPESLKGLSRRGKAKLRTQAEADAEIHGTIVDNNKPRSLESTRKTGDSILTSSDPAEIEKDIKITQQSIAKGWNVPSKRKLVRRLLRIADKTSGDLNTKDGIVPSETVADKLAIDAIKVLAMMNGQDVARLEKNKPQGPSTVVNVNQNVINNNTPRFDPRTIELARLAYNIGAREFSVDGKLVPITEIISVGKAEPIQTEEGSLRDTKKASDETSPKAT